MVDLAPPQTDTFAGYDGTPLLERAWLPATAPRGVIILVHGYAEHSGRYEHVGEALAARGYAVHAFDLRGHGRSGGQRAIVRSFAEYVADLRIFLARVRVQHPRVPLFLFGHSMGGGIVTLAAIIDPPRVDGILLTGPALGAGSVAAPMRALVQALARLLPSLPLTKLDAGAISRDPGVCRRYDDDPLVYRGRIKAGLAAAMMRAGERIARDMGDIHYPLLIMHGTLDALASLAGSERLYAQAPSTDKMLKLYEGLYHEILNESERDQVIADMLEWLDARTAPPA